MTGGLYELFELRVGDGRAIDPEAVDAHAMGRRLFRVMPAGAHPERPTRIQTGSSASPMGPPAMATSPAGISVDGRAAPLIPSRLPDPDRARSQRALAALLFGSGDDAEAEQVQRAAIGLKPADPESLPGSAGG